MKKLALFLVLVLLMGTLTACGGESTATTEVDTARFVGDWNSLTPYGGALNDLYSFRLLPSGSAVLTRYAVTQKGETVAETSGGQQAHWETHDNKVYLFPTDNTFDKVIILQVGSGDELIWQGYTYKKAK